MSDLEDRLPKPPEPPALPRRFRMYSYQWIGIPLLFLAPVALALAGVFGQGWTIQTVETPTFTAKVQYADALRYKQVDGIRVWISSRTPGSLDTIRIAVDSAYASRFSSVRAIPAFDRPYQLSLAGPRASDVAVAVVEIQAERYGRHEGDLVIAAGDTARVRLRTIVFP